MIERKYRCKTCGGEWSIPNSASQHHRRYPDHEIEVLDINKETGEVKSNPYSSGKGEYRKALSSTAIKKQAPEVPPGQNPGPTNEPPPKFVMVGTIRMPLEDFGYSSSLNFLTVLEAYDRFKKEFNFPGKMGDFCALMITIIKFLTGGESDGAGSVSMEVHTGEGNAQSGEKS